MDFFFLEGYATHPTDALFEQACNENALIFVQAFVESQYFERIPIPNLNWIMHDLSESEQLDVALILIESKRGEDIHTSHLDRILDWACNCGQWDIVRRMIDSGIEEKISTLSLGKALQTARQDQQYDIIERINMLYGSPNESAEPPLKRRRA